MNYVNKLFCLALLIGSFGFVLIEPSPVHAEDAAGGKLRVVTTLTDIAWAAREIGKDKVEVVSLLSGSAKEDPHYAYATPDFIQKVANADVVCLVGLDLEVGWMPKVLSRSGNARVQSGGAGYCELGRAAEVLERPSGALDRSNGDVHPKGNPHFWLSPVAFSKAAREIADALSRVRPQDAEYFNRNYALLQSILAQLAKEGQSRLAPALRILKESKGAGVLQYHSEFHYVLNLYGIPSFGTIEEKPGVQPSVGRITEVALGAKGAGVRLILGATHNPRAVIEKAREISGIPAIVFSTSLAKEGEGSDYPKHHLKLVDALANALAAPAVSGASERK